MSFKPDPITLQVLTSAAYSVAEEMSVALIRTSRSTNIKDRRDASCALYDTAAGIAVISQSEIGTPLHLGVMGAAVGTALEKIPASSLEPVERDPERVSFDVRQGLVSRRKAKELYAVVQRKDGAVNKKATAAAAP